jgi:peroxiredoxin
LERDFWQPYGKEGLQVIGISVGEGEDEARKFKEKRQLTFPVFADEDGKVFPRLMQKRGIPYNIVIDRNGIVRYSAPGFRPEELASVIKPLLADRGTKGVD